MVRIITGGSRQSRLELIRPITARLAPDPELSARLSFYLVNFGISTATCITLFSLLQLIGFSIPLSLPGVLCVRDQPGDRA